MQSRLGNLSLFFVLLGIFACGSESGALSEPAGSVTEVGNQEEEESTELEETEESPGDEFIRRALEPWKGDLDQMVERRVVRALIAYNRTSYYLDRAQQRGLSYEALREFAKQVNKDFKTGSFKVQIAYLPVPRDRMIPYLIEGRGDLAVGNLTITPERLELVDFSDPVYPGVKEVVVAHSSVQGLNTLEDLSGREVYVRRSSSYYQSLQDLSRELKEAGRPEVTILQADENLETEDILEMVDAGMVKITVADDHLASFWEQLFDEIRVRRSLVLRSGAAIGWAFRKGSPILQKNLNTFVKTHKKGTLLGNILFNRYLKDAKRVKKVLTPDKVDSLSKMADLFKKYGEQYSFDWLLLAAQGYQESKLKQDTRSRAGAVGVMQIKPSTAADPNVNIQQVDKLENNIHAGTKYLRFLADRYFSDEDLDDVTRHLFALAAYNAGPRRVVAARKQAPGMGLDPNKWFQNVEVLVAKRVGRQPVDYVSHIYKYYLAYQLITAQRDAKSKVIEDMSQ